MRPGFAAAAHLAHGDSAGGSLRRSGAQALRVARDLLTYGPCDADPERHVRLRLRHWNLPDDEAPHFSLSPAVNSWPATQPIVLWATRAWSDQLFLWWALDALARAQIDRARLFWAAPATHHPLASCGAATDDELAIALAAAQPITPALADAARQLWRRYAAPSPLGFDQLRRAGVDALPDLVAIAAPHGGWFPRRSDGKLRLSRNDELLLRHLDHPLDVPELLFPYGDRLLLQRRDQWLARAGAQHLLDDGLDDAALAPPIHVGGCSVAGWIRVDDGSDFHLEPGA